MRWAGALRWDLDTPIVALAFGRAQGSCTLSNLSRFKVFPYRYFPTHLMEKEGPRHWAQLRLLQACERLNIPKELWPQFPKLMLPHEYGGGYTYAERCALPTFEYLYESEAEWKQRARDEFEEFLEECAAQFRASLRGEIESGRLTAVKPSRETTPLDLRYEWAARRHCLRVPYKSMAQKGYTEARIRQSVTRILREAGLRADVT